MADPIVVQIARAGGNLMIVDLHRAPHMPIEPTGAQFFTWDPGTFTPWTEPDAVRKRGQQMLQLLCNTHADIKKILDSELGSQGNGDGCPIYFWLKNVSEAEQLSWESLCDAQGKFLALQRRWPIARMVGARLRPPVNLSETPIDQQHPLRIAALLSAAQVSAAREWEHMYQAVTIARQNGVPIRLQVFTGEEGLHDTIQQASQQDSLLSVIPIRNRTIELENALDEFAPHLVHFFCHGSASFNVPRLELATFLTWNGVTDGEQHLILDVDQLGEIPALRSAWLVTLNCCEGAAAAKEVLSLTYRLVQSGVSATVGMAEALDVLDAHEFCAGFYPAVLRKLKAAFGRVAQGHVVPLEWADCLHAPRTALRDRHSQDPANFRQWTLPVLYVQTEPLELVATVGATPQTPNNLSPTSKQAHQETIEGLLRTLSPDEARLLREELEKIQQEEDTGLHP